jgi:Ca-activated chloride channel homolog
MKRYLAISIFVFCFFSAALPQSGRKIKAAPSPAVTSPIDDTPSYSESKPKPKRPVWIAPSLRGGSTGSKSDQVSSVKPIMDTTADDPDGEVKVETNLVTIPVSVFDRNGLYIPNLRQSDFKVFEDGKEQEIAYFGASEKPFTVILLIDTSPSTEYKIDDIRSAAVAFVDQLKPQDQVMVIEFDANVHVLTESTSDRQLIYKGIRRADFGGGTSLYDAVDFSLKKRLSKIEGRKAIVLFTDGVDTTSRKANYDSTLGLAEESDSLIFPIYYNTYFDNRPGIFSPFPGTIGGRSNIPDAQDYAVGRKYLEELADYTGGRVFRPEATPGGLTTAFEGIAEELRRQYQIGYVPADDSKIGQRKQIKVRVDQPNLVIRARDSYIVGTATSAAPQTPKSTN